MSTETFRKKFAFTPSLSLYIGVEQECFLTDKQWNIQPLAVQALAILGEGPSFGYELSACQLEHRVGPCTLEELPQRLKENEALLKKAQRVGGFRRLYAEVGPQDMPLDVYPHPRYKKMIAGVDEVVLSAACRVTGVHIHIGMPNHQIALRVYNKVIQEMKPLCKMGDGSRGERLRLYAIMAPHHQPQPYQSWREFALYAISAGFADDPRRCWHLIRISPHGTIEFRMFGGTNSHSDIIRYAKTCRALCEQAM